MDAGLVRLHVSLQTESLVAAGDEETWGVREWLAPTVTLTSEGPFQLRVNLPVPARWMRQTEVFLRAVTADGIDVKVFSVLPEGDVRDEDYPLRALETMVERMNVVRERHDRGRVLLRGYRPPEGIRCPTCPDRARCMERSHSLRLGADLTLRLCPATREWDTQFMVGWREAAITEAALLALDYRW